MSRYTLALTGAALALTAAAPTAAQMLAPPADPEPVIKEWTVPWGAEGRPRDPFMPADGERVFFVGQSGNYIGSLDPETGQFQQYEIPEGTHPHNLIVDETGMVWYAGNRNATIGRLDPNTGEVKAFPMPEGVRDPHTLVFDTKGNIWFTAQGAGKVGRLNMASGQVDVVDTDGPRPYGIVMDDQDHPWIVLFGTNRVMTVDPATMAPRYFDLPRENTRPRRIARTTDGMIWYGDWTAGMLGRLNPESGAVQEWQLPGGERARPYAMGVDSRDRVWVFQTGVDPNTLVGFDPNTQAFLSETAVPSGGRTVRHMHYHAPTNSFWFGADTGTIGQVILP